MYIAKIKIQHINLLPIHAGTMTDYFLTFVIVIIIIIYVGSNNRYKWLYITAKTFKRDRRGKKLFNYARNEAKIIKKENLTVHKIYAKILKNYPDRVAIVFEEQKWTFAMVDEYANRIGNYFNLEGFAKGDCVGLLHDNRPEYICIWLGLSKLGVCCALLNTNFMENALSYSIKTSKCKGLIFGHNYIEIVSKICYKEPNIRLYQMQDSYVDRTLLSNATNLTETLNQVSNSPIEVKNYITFQDPLLYIYNSSSTETPEATIFTHTRFLTLEALENFFFLKDDIIYNPVPLYHSFGVMGVALTIASGITVVITKKFSASRYWSDCCKHDCTIAMYIGEMCRYTLSVPTISIPKHKVRAIFGSGLRREIWLKLTKKTRISQVLEFYSSTEGVIVLVNLDNRIGSIGFIPRYQITPFPIQLVKYNEETAEPIRNANGLCITCEIGEPGLALGKIDDNQIITFQGYTNKSHSTKKIIRNVLEIEDAYFNSEDILVRDELGYVYFKDTIGDTFKWKGESVYTREVESMISKLLQNISVVVFGVKVPGTEGKAGMAVIIDPQNIVNLNELSIQLKSELPKYALPLFIRFSENMPLTTSYKINKTQLKLEGYDLNIVNDRIFLFNKILQQYVPFTKELYDNICHNK